MPNEGVNRKKSEIFGTNVADKYDLAVTKNLGLGCNFRPCSSDCFVITNPSFEIQIILGHSAYEDMKCYNFNYQTISHSFLPLCPVEFEKAVRWLF